MDIGYCEHMWHTESTILLAQNNLVFTIHAHCTCLGKAQGKVPGKAPEKAPI